MNLKISIQINLESALNQTKSRHPNQPNSNPLDLINLQISVKINLGIGTQMNLKISIQINRKKGIQINLKVGIQINPILLESITARSNYDHGVPGLPRD